jgi:hypothetical protein
MASTNQELLASLSCTSLQHILVGVDRNLVFGVPNSRIYFSGEIEESNSSNYAVKIPANLTLRALLDILESEASSGTKYSM